MSKTLKQVLADNKETRFDWLGMTAAGFNYGESEMFYRRKSALEKDPQTLEMIRAHDKEVPEPAALTGVS